MARHFVIELDDELGKKLEDWRATKRPIPSLKDSVITLLTERLNNGVSDV